MSATERRESLLKDTEDVARDDQIFLMAYQQSAHPSDAKTIEEFDYEINHPTRPISKMFFRYKTPKGIMIDIMGSDYLIHIQKGKHPLTPKQWESILENIDNLEYAYTDGSKGHYVGTPVQMAIKTDYGLAGVNAEFLSNGRILIVSAFIDIVDLCHIVKRFLKPLLLQNAFLLALLPSVCRSN